MERNIYHHCSLLAGCNGPKTATHTVTINQPVGTPSFTLGSTSTRCQGSGPVTYAATAANTTGITYTLDAASLAGGNTSILQPELLLMQQDGMEHQRSLRLQQDVADLQLQHIL